MGTQDEFKTITSAPIFDIQLADLIEQQYDLQIGSRENLELVVFNLEDRIAQAEDVLTLCTTEKHYHIMWTLKYLIETEFKPALEAAQAKLEQAAF